MNDQIQIGFYSKPLISDIEYEIHILLLPFFWEKIMQFWERIMQFINSTVLTTTLPRNYHKNFVASNSDCND